jgi:hypothetical protein
MAVFTRTNGNAQNVVSVGNIALSTEATSSGLPISTGIGKPIQCFGITANATLATQLGTGEAVETILRTVGINTTLLAYQLNAALLSVVVEEANVAAADLGTACNTALAGSFTVNVTDVGLKLATS